MKVLIVNPSRFYSGDWGGGQLQHLFLLYSYLRTHSRGVEVEVLDLEQELFKPDDDARVADFVKLARAALESVDFDIVGISCWTSLHYLASVTVAEICKDLNPQATVIVGGYHPSALPGDFAYENTPFDYIVVGEGEIAFSEIVAGQVPKETHPQIVEGRRVDIAQVDLLWDEYSYYRASESISLWLSRGCPFSCSFCLDRLTTWRGYSPAQAIAELTRMVAVLPRARSVGFLDPIFGFNRAWRREFLDELLAADLDLAFWAETRADVLEEEDVKRIGAMNFVMDIGLDAVSPTLIAIMMKARRPDRYVEDFLRTDAWMNKYKVPHSVYSILNYPGETSETLKETLQFWTSYYRQHPDTYAVFSAQTFKFFPGNDVFANWSHYERTYGAQVLHPEWWKLRRPVHSDLSSHVVPSRELLDAGKLDYHKNVFRVITSLAESTVSDEAYELMKAQRSAPVALRVAHAHLRDKYVALASDSVLHEHEDGQIALFNFASGERHACTEEEASWLKRLVEDGATVGNLEMNDPAAEGHADQRAGAFARRMITGGFLRVDTAPPPADVLQPGVSYHVVIHTDLGAMELELLSDEAPRTVANFVYLAGLGYYDGMRASRAYPGAFIEFGEIVPGDGGPGYALPQESTPRVHRRGSLSMNIARHAAKFTLCRRAWQDLDGRHAVFGEITGGWEVLDSFLQGDDIAGVEIRTRAIDTGSVSENAESRSSM